MTTPEEFPYSTRIGEKNAGILPDPWSIIETEFHPEKLHHGETIFTLGNGYLGTRGAFEEAYPAEVRSTFLHGVFDDVPVFFTELANAPDWLEMDIFLAGEPFETRPVKISDSGRIRNELQTLCAEALEFVNSHTIRLHLDRIPPEVISYEKQKTLLEVLRWYKKRHPLWFSWMELAESREHATPL